MKNQSLRCNCTSLLCNRLVTNNQLEVVYWKLSLVAPQRAPNSLAHCSGGVGGWNAGSRLAST